jgi:hypothetical protein
MKHLIDIEIIFCCEHFFAAFFHKFWTLERNIFIRIFWTKPWPLRHLKRWLQFLCQKPVARIFFITKVALLNISSVSGTHFPEHLDPFEGRNSRYFYSAHRSLSVIAFIWVFFYVTLRRDYNTIRATAERHEWLKEWNDNITNEYMKSSWIPSVDPVPVREAEGRTSDIGPP